jgi:spore coat protein CotF
MNTKIINYYEITRETSKYNKNTKWTAKTYNKDMKLLATFGFKTEKEARESVKGALNVPVGNHFNDYYYEEIKKEELK